MRRTAMSLILALLTSAIVVARSAPTEAAVCGAPGAPTTTVYLPNITKTLGGPTGWVTPFIVQNVGTTATTLEVSFYRFSDGELVACRSVPGLLPGTSFADIPNSDADLPDNSQFSVVVRSFGSDVVAVVNEHQGEAARAESLSYVGLTSGAMKVGLPWVAKSDGGWLTTFIVQNLGAAPAAVTVAFTNEDGTKTASLTRTILPGRSAAVNPAVEPGLEDGVSYAAVFTADQPIGVVANAHNDAPTAAQPMAFSYNGVPLDAGNAYVAWVGRNADGGRFTTVVIENLGTTDATPTLTFRRIGGAQQTTFSLGSVKPARAIRYVLPPAGPTCLAIGGPTCPGEGEHSLVVSGGSFGVLAYTLGLGAAMGVTGGATAPTRMYLPNVTRTLGGTAGWTTPIVVQSAGATTLILRWHRFADGALAVTQYVPGLTSGDSVRVDPRAVTELADNAQYAVVVDGNGPMRAAVLELSATGGDGAMAYEGFTATGTLSAAPTLTSLTLTPATSGVGFGGTQQLTATVKDQFGNAVTGVPLTWTVEPTTMGTITPAGLFTAAQAQGTATVRATFGTLSATATLSVTPQTVTVGGFTFNVRATASADIYTESTISSADAQTISTTVTVDIAQIQTTYARSFTTRPPVYVFRNTATYTAGLVSVLEVSAADAAIIGPQTCGVFRVVVSGGGGATKRHIGLNWEKTAAEPPITCSRHELTHVMVDQIAKPTTLHEVPAWLDEGSARLEEFTIPGTNYWLIGNRYSAASMVATRNYFTVAELTSQDAWNARTGGSGIHQYYEASQLVQLLRNDVGTPGVIRILDLFGSGQPLETAFQTVTGTTLASFEATAANRIQAISQFYPGIATAQDEPGGRAGLSYVLYGFAPNAQITLDLRGQSTGVFNTNKIATVNEYGVRRSYLGPDWPADTYVITATGPTPPSSTEPGKTVTVTVTTTKPVTLAYASLTY